MAGPMEGETSKKGGEDGKVWDREVTKSYEDVYIHFLNGQGFVVPQVEKEPATRKVPDTEEEVDAMEVDEEELSG
jgi:hypothetical protein